MTIEVVANADRNSNNIDNCRYCYWYMSLLLLLLMPSSLLLSSHYSSHHHYCYDCMSLSPLLYYHLNCFCCWYCSHATMTDIFTIAIDACHCCYCYWYHHHYCYQVNTTDIITIAMIACHCRYWCTITRIVIVVSTVLTPQRLTSSLLLWSHLSCIKAQIWCRVCQWHASQCMGRSGLCSLWWCLHKQAIYHHFHHHVHHLKRR